MVIGAGNCTELHNTMDLCTWDSSLWQCPHNVQVVHSISLDKGLYNNTNYNLKKFGCRDKVPPTERRRRRFPTQVCLCHSLGPPHSPLSSPPAPSLSNVPLTDTPSSTLSQTFLDMATIYWKWHHLGPLQPGRHYSPWRYLNSLGNKLQYPNSSTSTSGFFR